MFAPISECDFINSRPAKVAGPVVPILAACCGSESSENNLTVGDRSLTFRVPAMPAFLVRDQDVESKPNGARRDCQRLAVFSTACGP